MNKRLVFLIAIRGLRTRHAPSATSAAAGRPSGSAPGTADASRAGSSSSASLASEQVVTPADAVNLAAPEIGGHIELVTSEEDREDRGAIHLIDRARLEDSSWRAARPRRRTSSSASSNSRQRS
jgi:hypothetical protein